VSEGELGHRGIIDRPAVGLLEADQVHTSSRHAWTGCVLSER
jgi:hypothetical protein